jgi:hypothetical protein
VIILYHPLDAKFLSHCLRNFEADVAHRRQFRFRDLPYNVATMHTSHAPGADYSNLYFSGHFIVSPV